MPVTVEHENLWEKARLQMVARRREILERIQTRNNDDRLPGEVW